MSEQLEDLHILYRPKVLEEVIGQDHVIRSLQDLGDKVPHAILLEGPSGVGKTTIARIIAGELLGIEHPQNIREVDAATYAKAEDARQLVTSLRNKPLNGGDLMVILDEVHALSSQAWQVLLKSLEEPPPHVYFVLCTTESGKVPKTIRTRCHAYALNELRRDDLFELVGWVNDEEFQGEVPEEVLSVCVQAAAGSARQAVVNLSKVSACDSSKEAAEILQEVEQGNAEVIELCRLLSNPPSRDEDQYYKEACRILSGLKDNTSPESVRLVVLSYMSSILLSPKGARDARWLVAVLDAFKSPCAGSEKYSPILRAIGYLAYQS